MCAFGSFGLSTKEPYALFVGVGIIVICAHLPLAQGQRQKFHIWYGYAHLPPIYEHQIFYDFDLQFSNDSHFGIFFHVLSCLHRQLQKLYQEYRDHSGLWQKKHLTKVPFQGRKSTFLAKKHFQSRKKHLVNIILLTKSNRKVLTIKLFSLVFICMIKFLRARCKCK